MRYAPILLAAVLGARCVPENLAVELPDAREMNAMIVAIESEGVLALEAARLVEGTPDRSVIRSFREGASVTVLYYREPMEVLGFDSGRIEPRIDREGLRPLPAFDRAFVAGASQGTISSWAPLDSLPASLRAVRIAPPSDACRPWEVLPVDPLPGAERSIGVALDDGSALIVFNNDERMFRVFEDGHSVELTVPPGFHPLSAYRSPNGVVWFAVDNTLIPWTEGQGAGAPIAEETGTELGWIVGSRDSAVEEIFSLTWNGELWRFADGRFDRLLTSQHQGVGFFLGAGQGIDWRAPNEVIALVRDSDEVYETFALDGGVRAEAGAWQLSTTNGLHDSVSELEGFGTVLANNLQRFFHRKARGDAWTELGDQPFPQGAKGLHTVNSMIAAPPRSFVYAGHLDLFGEYDREAGHCPLFDLGLGLDVRKVVRIGDGYLCTGARVRVNGADITTAMAAIVRRKSR